MCECFEKNLISSSNERKITVYICWQIYRDINASGNDICFRLLYLNSFKMGSQTFTLNCRIVLKVYLCIKPPSCLKTVRFSVVWNCTHRSIKSISKSWLSLQVKKEKRKKSLSHSTIGSRSQTLPTLFPRCSKRDSLLGRLRLIYSIVPSVIARVCVCVCVCGGGEAACKRLFATKHWQCNLKSQSAQPQKMWAILAGAALLPNGCSKWLKWILSQRHMAKCVQRNEGRKQR